MAYVIRLRWQAVRERCHGRGSRVEGGSRDGDTRLAAGWSQRGGGHGQLRSSCQRFHSLLAPENLQLSPAQLDFAQQPDRDLIGPANTRETSGARVTWSRCSTNQIRPWRNTARPPSVILHSACTQSHSNSLHNSVCTTSPELECRSPPRRRRISYLKSAPLFGHTDWPRGHVRLLGRGGSARQGGIDYGRIKPSPMSRLAARRGCATPQSRWLTSACQQRVWERKVPDTQHQPQRPF